LSDLAPLLDEVADGAGVARRSAGERVEYLVGDRLVAVLEAAGVEFRLRPDVVAAALRTPDAHVSPRGPEWVAFRPRALDRFALDRVVAWFAFAVRGAGG
jgi:hypothetical protein